MTFLENPFTLTPAVAMEFAGRHYTLERRQARLTEGSDAWIRVFFLRPERKGLLKHELFNDTSPLPMRSDTSDITAIV